MNSPETSKSAADISFLETADIAIVRDGAVLSRFVENVLRTAGFSVTVFPSHREFLRLFAAKSSTFGMVIFEVQRSLSAFRSSMKEVENAGARGFMFVIGLLSGAMARHDTDIIKDGADAVWVMPLDSRRLLLDVESLFRMRARVKQSVEANFRWLANKFDVLQQEENIRRRNMQRDMIYSSTVGRVLILNKNEFSLYVADMKFPHMRELKSMNDVSSVRVEVENDCMGCNLSDQSVEDVTLCVSELGSNVVKHGNGGTLEYGFFAEENAYVLYFLDHGSGIDESFLMDALLYKGVSSKLSMGMGFTFIMEVCDELVLSTGPTGTGIVFKKKTQDTSEDELDLGLQEILNRF